MIRREEPARLTPNVTDAVVFCLLWATYAYFFQGGFSNQNSRFDLTMALAFEHRLTIDSFHSNTIDKVIVGGHAFTEKAPLVSYLALPVPAIASLFVSIDDVLGSPRLSNALLYLSTVMSVSLLSAVSGAFFRRVLLVLNPALPPRAAMAFTLATFAGTLALPYSTMLFGHQVAAAWLTLALFFALTCGEHAHRAAACFFFLGLALVTEYPVLPAALAVAAIAVVRRRHDMKRTVAYGLVALVPLALLPLHNLACFGHPWRLGYGALGGTQFGAGMSRGLFGVGLPSPAIAGELLFGRYRGLFAYSPLLVIAVLASSKWPAAARRTVATPLVVGAGGVVALISGYSFWQGGACFGPRHLVAIVPLLASLLAFVPARWLRAPWLYAAIVASFAVNVMGTVITPFITERELSPLSRAYVPLLLQGRVSITPLDFLTPFAETSMRFARGGAFRDASWNLGELAGLRGWASVAPLALAWAITLVVWARAERRNVSVRPTERGRAAMPLSGATTE